MSKYNWLIAEIEAHRQNLSLFKKKLDIEEIERLEVEAEDAPTHIREWCKRKIKELKR